MEGVTLVLLVGGWGQSATESVLRGAHYAAARDLLERLLSTDALERAVVATDDAEWGERLADLPVAVSVDRPAARFHFGQRLAGLIERYEARRVLYAGGASAPLMSIEQWTEVTCQLAEAERLVIANNLHSCDWLGVVPADEAIPLIAREENDNALAWVLARQGGLPEEDRPPSAATRFDLDTPADLLIAQRHPAVGQHLGRFLEGLRWHTRQLDGLLSAMSREGGSLAVAGRVSSASWSALERETSCWVRVFAEERGMRASGRQAQGAVRSLLSDYLTLVGAEGFFDELAALADGAFLDDRVILAARGLWPDAEDRFNSDLLQWESVRDPFLRAFTRAAANARIPVLLGGHSVVAGGLLALIEAYQAGKEMA